MEWKQKNNFHDKFISLIEILKNDINTNYFDFRDFIFVGKILKNDNISRNYKYTDYSIAKLYKDRINFKILEPLLNQELKNKNDFLTSVKTLLKKETKKTLLDLILKHSEHKTVINNFEFNKNVIFNGSVFYDNTIFDNIRFNKYSEFKYVSFKDNIEFINNFSLNFDFQYANFGNRAYFKEIKNKGLNFMYSNFEEKAIFDKINSLSYSSFSEMKFANTFSLNNSKFKHHVDFSRTIFETKQIYRNLTLFKNIEFDGEVDFGNTEFHSVIDFNTIIFNHNVSFINTVFAFKENAYTNSSVNFISMIIGENCVMEFKSTNKENKIFQHYVSFQKEIINGTILFENVNFNKIHKNDRARFLKLQKDNKIIIGSGCLKYKHQTEVRTIYLKNNLQGLLSELMNIFVTFFIDSNGLNLGMEIIEKDNEKITFFYFSDEDFTKKEFHKLLEQTEFNFMNFLDIDNNQSIGNLLPALYKQNIKGKDINNNLEKYNEKQKQKNKFIKRINNTRELISNNKIEDAINEIAKLAENNSSVKNKVILVKSLHQKSTVSSSVLTFETFTKINKSLLDILDELQRNDLIVEESPNINFSEKKNLPFAIKQIHIKNFRGIDEIKLQNIPIDAQWIFLTGENGYGKTSFLQAIVVGLIGKKDEDRILVKDKDNTSIGIEFLQNHKSQINNIDSPSFLSFPTFTAYGSSRLMTQGKVTNFKKIQSSQSYSLFNDDGVLLDIEVKLKEWIRSDKAEEQQLYKSTKNVLLKLLPDISDIIIKNNEIFYIERDRNIANKNYRPLLFEDLAAGFRSIIAMVGDIIIRLLKHNQLDSFTKIEDLSGIIIIDEFDLHLHPKWQKRFVELLTKTFPKIQFIVSTHSVIPILGAPENSIFLNVDRTVKEGITIKRLDINVKTLLPNSLLTSPLFDFFDITQSEYNAEIDNLRTEDNYNEISFNKEIKKQIEEYAKNNNIKKEGGK